MPDTRTIVQVFTQGTPKEQDKMCRLLFRDRDLRNLLFGITKQYGGERDFAEHALLEAVLDLKTQVQRGNFKEGNWVGMIRIIFQAKYSQVSQTYKDKIDTVEMMDFLLQPFEEVTSHRDHRYGYELCFHLFDKIPWCVENYCALICREQIENDHSTQELITAIENVKNIPWDKKRTNENDSTKQINQRMRDRVSDCWERLRNYIRQNDPGQFILNTLKS